MSRRRIGSTKKINKVSYWKHLFWFSLFRCLEIYVINHVQQTLTGVYGGERYKLEVFYGFNQNTYYSIGFSGEGISHPETYPFYIINPFYPIKDITKIYFFPLNMIIIVILNKYTYYIIIIIYIFLFKEVMLRII